MINRREFVALLGGAAAAMAARSKGAAGDAGGRNPSGYQRLIQLEIGCGCFALV